MHEGKNMGIMTTLKKPTAERWDSLGAPRRLQSAAGLRSGIAVSAAACHERPQQAVHGQACIFDPYPYNLRGKHRLM